MDTFFGVPAHPLLVHIPAVLMPLATLGVVLMVIRPAWHQRCRWAVPAIGFVGALGAILAAGAGESPEPWYLDRRKAAGRPIAVPTAVGPALAALVLIASAAMCTP